MQKCPAESVGRENSKLSWRAAMNAIEYLQRFGFTGEQAYLLLGAAPIEGRIGGIVDIPNCCCTISIPTAIFEQDILPT